MDKCLEDGSSDQAETPEASGDTLPPAPANAEQLLRSLPRSVRRLVVTSQAEEPTAFVLLEIVTFADLWPKAAAVVDFIERVWHELLPRPVKLAAAITPTEQVSIRPSRRFGLTPGSARWAELRDLLLQGRIARLGLEDWESHHSHQLRFDADLLIEVEFGYRWGQAVGHTLADFSTFDPQYPRVLSLRIATRALRGGLNPETQRQLVGLAQTSFQAVEGTCGFIDVATQRKDFALSPYEQGLGMDLSNLKRLWRDVRGAFWGNLLSPYHVARLGGWEVVKRHAPCPIVAPLRGANPTASPEPGAYLQLAGALGATTAADYRKLESFLAPILISDRDQVRYKILEPALVAGLGGTRASNREWPSTPFVSLGYRLALRWWPTPIPPEGRRPARPSNALGFTMLWGIGRYHNSEAFTLPILLVSGNAEGRLPPRPKSGPLVPVVVVEPYILTDTIKIGVTFAGIPADADEQALRRLIQQWRNLAYDLAVATPMIRSCSAPERTGNLIAWQADLAPVGQDAYFQLVLMLDEFSKSVARLAEVRIAPGNVRGADDAI